MISQTQAQRPNGLTKFLEQAGALRSPRSERPAVEPFEATLGRALAQLGVDPGEVRVTPARAGGRDGERQFVVSIRRPAEPAGGSAAAEGGGAPTADAACGCVVGGRLGRSQWTPEMLTGDLAPETLQSVSSPSEFLQARLAEVRRPTEANVTNDHDGTASPLNSSFLSTREQAEQMQRRLEALGLTGLAIEEMNLNGGPFQVDWNGEDRRIYTVGGLCVGLLVEKYARNTAESADRMILDQFRV